MSTSIDQDKGDGTADYEMGLPQEEEAEEVPLEETFLDEARDVKQETAEDGFQASMMSTEQRVKFMDHFTLGTPSSAVRFRGNKVTIYDLAQEQIMIEEQKDSNILTVKRTRTGTFGHLALRTIYTLAALLLLGFLFVLSFQIFIFLFLNLLVTSGQTTERAEIDTDKLIGSILSIPLLVYSLASLMSYGTVFVVDVWEGLRLFRALLHLPPVVMEWISLCAFIFIPFLALGIALVLERENWWEVFSGTLMISMFIVFIVFSFVVVCREFQFCMQLISAKTRREGQDIVNWFRLIPEAMLTTLKHRYAGYRCERYNVHGNQELPAGGYALSADHQPAKVYIGLYSRITTYLGCSFDKIETPKRRFTVAELRQDEPFITKNNWSLERLYCRGYGAPSIFSAEGPDGLSRFQLISTMICSTIGFILVALVILSLSTYFGLGGTVLLAIVIIIIICCGIPLIQQAFLYSTVIKDSYSTEDQSNGDDNDEAASSVFQVWEKVTITEPRPWYCWTRVVLEFGFLFLWPLITLFTSESTPLAIFFLIVGYFSFWRVYFDAGAVLSEIGSMDTADTIVQTSLTASLRFWFQGSTVTKTNDNDALTGKARTSEVLGRITHSPFNRRWIMVFVVFAFIQFVLMRMAAGVQGETNAGYGRYPLPHVSDFSYPGKQDSLKYGSCNLPPNNFTFAEPTGQLTLRDFSLLSFLAYETTNVTQYHLDQQFGEGVAIDNAEFVEQYQRDIGRGNGTKGITYKLITFPSNPSAAIVAIRGTQTGIDTVVNVQLWAASLLAQVIQKFVPFGWLWTDILDNMVTAVSWVEGGKLEQVSYYKHITKFVNALLEDNYGGSAFESIRITGASLGGGLALISAAQTRATAVAISGPNIVLARNAVKPPVTVEALNERTFNVVPDRDIIVRIGTLSPNIQRIECTKPFGSLLGCHSMFQTYCELQTNCGSNGRPVYCECVGTYNYPEPEGNGNTTSFAEACANSRAALINALPVDYASYSN